MADNELYAEFPAEDMKTLQDAVEAYQKSSGTHISKILSYDKTKKTIDVIVCTDMTCEQVTIPFVN